MHDSLGRTDLLGRHQLLLDLTKPDVRDYIVESVGKVLDSAPISYVKWDMNCHSCALGAKQHEFILGLYDVLRRIFEPRPEVLLRKLLVRQQPVRLRDALFLPADLVLG